MSDRRHMGDASGAPLADSGVVRLAQGFARRMGLLARGNGADEMTCRYVRRAALEVSLATSEGHVCVPLDNLLDVQASGELFPGDAPALSVWRNALFASGLCAPADLTQALTGDAQANAFPLLLDDHDRLYLARYYGYEARLAAALGRKLAMTVGVSGAAEASGMTEASKEPQASNVSITPEDRARLHRYFGDGVLRSPEGLREPNWQMAAAALALERSLVVLSGGPGTGKTTTVVGLLACLLERDANLRVALAAPTGKAAQRMQEALTARQDLPETVRRALPEAAVTLHRLLGVLPESAEQVGRRFRHHAGNPLPYDLIVVDEASMIDLSMATALLEAVPDGARLILLGDKDQLAAVEAGAVFGELSAQRVFSQTMRAELLSALAWPEDDLPLSGPLAVAAAVGAKASSASSTASATARPSASPAQARVVRGLEDAVIWLERTYRFGAHSAIGRLATAIRMGKVIDARKECAVVAVEQSEARPGTAMPGAQGVASAHAADDRVLLSEDGGIQLSQGNLNALADGYGDYLDALAQAIKTIEQLGDPAAATSADIAMVAQPVFAAFGRFRVLCATRGGRRGVEFLGAQLTALLARRAGVALGAGGGAWFAGRPVLVTQNEYALNLFNGDIGIALPLGPSGTLRVAFATPDGGYRLYSPASLPAHETAFAMTIHKSQGSEFERVAIVLPEQASRVLSRELIYTGVTRARREAWLFAPWSVIASAIARPTQRDGGLTDRLTEVLTTMSDPPTGSPPLSLPR